jgi:hypothetical protein
MRQLHDMVGRVGVEHSYIAHRHVTFMHCQLSTNNTPCFFMKGSAALVRL